MDRYVTATNFLSPRQVSVAIFVRTPREIREAAGVALKHGLVKGVDSNWIGKLKRGDLRSPAGSSEDQR